MADTAQEPDNVSDRMETSKYVSDRDPNKIHDNLKVSFNDVFAEPQETQSYDKVWDVSQKTFACTTNLCYKLLTACCGVPLAFCWAFAFACIFCEYIWCVTPALKAYKIIVRPIRELFQLIVGVFMVPCFDACGHVFNRIRITQAQGEPPKEMV